MKPTVDAALLAVRQTSSGEPHSHGVTGGVYKTRERIHRGMLIRDYYTIGFLGFAPPHGFAALCSDHCMTCEALAIRAMRT